MNKSQSEKQNMAQSGKQNTKKCTRCYREGHDFTKCVAKKDKDGNDLSIFPTFNDNKGNNNKKKNENWEII